MWVGIDSLVRRHGDRLLTPHCNKPTSAATLPCSSVTSLEHHSGLRWGHDTALCRYSPPQNRNETSFTRDASDNSWPKQLLPKAIQKVCHYESGKSSANCGLRFHCGTFSIVFRFVSLRILVFCCRYLGMMFLDGFDLVVCVLNWSLNNVVFVCMLSGLNQRECSYYRRKDQREWHKKSLHVYRRPTAMPHGAKVPWIL